MTSSISSSYPDLTAKELWSGVPRQGIVLRSSDLFLIPFSFLWAGFAFFWEVTAIRQGAPNFFLLWGVPFMLVGIYITVGRFFIDAKRRRNTSYTVTNDSVVIRSGVFSLAVKSLSLATLSDVTLTERPDGSGTITFGSNNIFSSMYAGIPWPGVPQVPSFELIQDARMVYDLIRNAQRKNLAGS